MDDNVRQYIDCDWYVDMYPDVAVAGVDPVYHFLSFGMHEGRNPNPWFDTLWYATTYSDVAVSELLPFYHYLAVGRKRGYSPHPQFDCKKYINEYPEAADDPLLHRLQRHLFSDSASAAGGGAVTSPKLLQLSVANPGSLSMAIPSEMERLPPSHMPDISGHISIDSGGSAYLDPGIRIVLVCFTNRCGSNYFCELLRSTGCVRPLGEIFNADFVIPYCQKHGLVSLSEYIAHIVTKRHFENIFVAKIAAEQILMLARSGLLNILENNILFVWIRRADKLGQAISLRIAEKTNRWASYAADKEADVDVEYVRDDVQSAIDWICLQEAAIDKFFAVNGFCPLIIDYDLLTLHPQLAVDLVADKLCVGHWATRPGEVGMRIQRETVNERWRQFFLARKK